MEELKLKRLSIEDLTSINVLYKQCFNDNISDTFFEWKYFSAFQHETVVVGLFDKNELIASGALLFEMISDNTKILKTLRCTDLMTHPNNRGKGASKKISAALNEYIAKSKVDVVYTMCSKIATKSFVKTGWKFQKPIHYYFKPSVLSRLSNSFSKQNKGFLHSDSLDVLLDVYQNKLADVEFLKFIEWRYSNFKYQYQLMFSKDKQEFITYTIHNNFLFIVDFETNQFSFLKHLDEIVIDKKLRGIIVLSSSNNIKKMKSSIFKGYFVNKFKFGGLKSILDFNLIKGEQKLREVYAYNYDDI